MGNVRFAWSDIGTARNWVDTVVVGTNVFSTVVVSSVVSDAVVSGTVVLITHKPATCNVSVTNTHTYRYSVNTPTSMQPQHNSLQVIDLPGTKVGVDRHGGRGTFS